MKKLTMLLLLGMMSLSAWALDLDSAKEQGLVGEQKNGYLGAVVNDRAALDLVESINQQRRQKYQEIATKRGAKRVTVEQFAGAKLIEKAAEDQHYYQNDEGSWVR